MGLNRHKTPRPAPSRAAVKPGIFAALDIGTTKVTCFIGFREQGKMGGTLPVRVIGIGHHPSHGLRAGTVVDMDAAEHAIRAAVDAAERMAGTTLRNVVVNLSAGAPKSKVINVEVDVKGREITEHDLSLGFVHGRKSCEQEDSQIIHSVPVGFSVDGSKGVRDPLGMFGDQLGIDMNVITASPGPIRNLIVCVERCHLNVSRLVVSPYASGLACLVEDELDLGVTCVDMGGGTTSIAVFAEGALQYASVVPIGGEAVTKDIAQGLSTPFDHAERMKTLYGSALGGTGDVKDLIKVPQVGDEGEENYTTIPKVMLTKIIRPRVEETLEYVRDRLNASGFGDVGGRRLVLTGGASQLTGIRELATRVLDKQVRLGQPIKLTGLADATRGPAFSTCAGLLAYESSPPPEAMGIAIRPSRLGGRRGLQFVRGLFGENV
ncbi:MAG: cell division protein FtsA [Alphaproteobacteria bacterium]|nr:MAG: cell division protein FtsA [Alphaproteobacteria bacterium]